MLYVEVPRLRKVLCPVEVFQMDTHFRNAFGGRATFPSCRLLAETHDASGEGVSI